MKHLLSTALTSILLSSLLWCSSCKKDEKNTNGDPSPTGSITGKFSPSDAITQVTATNNSNASFTFTATPNSGGVFTFNNINASTYTLKFTPATGFSAPPSYSQVVEVGQVSNLGTIIVRPDTTGGTGGTGGTVTYKVDGDPTIATRVSSALVSGVLSITAGSATQSMVLIVNGVTGPGVFAVGGLSTSSGTFTSGTASWASSTSATAGTIRVNSFDPSSRKASGTFSFAANPVTGTGATGSKTIADGIFTNVNF